MRLGLSFRRIYGLSNLLSDITSNPNDVTKEGKLRNLLDKSTVQNSVETTVEAQSFLPKQLNINQILSESKGKRPVQKEVSLQDHRTTRQGAVFGNLSQLEKQPNRDVLLVSTLPSIPLEEELGSYGVGNIPTQYSHPLVTFLIEGYWKKLHVLCISLSTSIVGAVAFSYLYPARTPSPSE